ncbi:MAG: DUF885 domain-containing protein [Candidatus Sericytochromatia bacterium]
MFQFWVSRWIWGGMLVALAQGPAQALIPPLGRTAVAPTPTHSAFQHMVDRYFGEFFARNPSWATYAGVHTYDHQLEDYTQAGREAERAFARTYLQRFEAFAPSHLTPAEAIDREMLLNSLRGMLLESETIRNWERNPDLYSSGITESIFTLMSRQFAPADVRLRAVIARQQQIPAVFEAARAQLKNPPRLFTEVAIDQLPGLVAFFEQDVPLAFAEVKDPALLAEFKASNQGVIAALQAYRAWLESDLLPRSQGDFRLGAEVYRQKLRYDEGVDLPLEKLLELGEADLRRNQAQFRQVAAQLDPQRSPADILEALNRDYPPPATLLQTFRDVMGGMAHFIRTHEILTLPAAGPPQVVETPPFMRALTFASMDTPGPFETRAKEAYFNVTLPEASWSHADVAEHMAGFNRGTIVSTAIHEAYPGHYIQFLWLQQQPSKVRALLGANTTSEGWAHYCEQMMLDEGYGEGDLTLRLGQLQDALLRNARFMVGIQMHTGQMSFEEGVDYFVKEGYQSRLNAERETLRGTSDPTYLYYTLGKLEILQLREDYRRKMGKDYTLKGFHDAFMQQGLAPVGLIRRALLGST